MLTSREAQKAPARGSGRPSRDSEILEQGKIVPLQGPFTRTDRKFKSAFLHFPFCVFLTSLPSPQESWVHKRMPATYRQQVSSERHSYPWKVKLVKNQRTLTLAIYRSKHPKKWSLRIWTKRSGQHPYPFQMPNCLQEHTSQTHACYDPAKRVTGGAAAGPGEVGNEPACMFSRERISRVFPTSGPWKCIRSGRQARSAPAVHPNKPFVSNHSIFI